jgi:hypothetical protein
VCTTAKRVPELTEPLLAEDGDFTIVRVAKEDKYIISVMLQVLHVR